jgi:hypothetical protein
VRCPNKGASSSDAWARLAVGGRGEAWGAWAGLGEKGEVGQAQMNRKVFDLFN